MKKKKERKKTQQLALRIIVSSKFSYKLFCSCFLPIIQIVSTVCKWLVLFPEGKKKKKKREPGVPKNEHYQDT